MTFPLKQYYEEGTGDANIYNVTDDGLTALDVTKRGNLASVTVTEPDLIAVVEKMPADTLAVQPESEEPINRIGFKDTLFVGGIALGILFLAGGIYTLAGKLKKKKSSQRKENEDNG